MAVAFAWIAEKNLKSIISQKIVGIAKAREKWRWKWSGSTRLQCTGVQLAKAKDVRLTWKRKGVSRARFITFMMTMKKMNPMVIIVTIAGGLAIATNVKMYG